MACLPKRILHYGLLMAATLILAGCADDSTIITQCQSVADRQPLCGWQRPEDMELLPDGETLIVSQMALGHGDKAGSLALLDTVSGLQKSLTVTAAEDGDLWGDPDCSTPVGSAIAPHGIHLSSRADDRLQLLVVNHGKRESVEIFELQPALRRLVWRGCAQPPSGSFLNDVVAVPEGGFIATHMYRKSNAAVGSLSFAEIKALLGFNPGHLLHWDGTRFRRLGDFSGDYPNGLQISADGHHLFVNLWAESRVQKVDRHSGKVLAQVSVTHPDNSQWDGDGKLLVTGHDFSINDLRICPDLQRGSCPAAFEVVEVDTRTMTARTLKRINGAPMGAGTVTQRVGDTWYIGSFLGDRVLTLPAPK